LFKRLIDFFRSDSMKKNVISVAVATALTGAMAAQAAVHVNPDKTGQVILFPFYNADNGNATNMHIVNTTLATKAVKIRFMEYKNSDEVLDFNLYLSPEDHFAFGVIKDPNGDGAAVITSDNSCTVPALGSANGAFTGTTTTNADGSITRIQPFVNYQYASDADNTMGRTLMGHVEVIEMGEVANGGTAATAHASFAKHGATGVPASCAGLNTSWASGGWNGDRTLGMSAPTGGIYGLAYHINVEDAAAFGFEPTALDDWEDGQVHYDPGNVLPSLSVNGTDDATVYDGQAGNDYYDTVTMPSNIQAVSAVLTQASLSNDVMVNPALGGETDWVVTFPTKRQHVDVALKANVVRPFVDNWVGKTATGVEDPACEEVAIEQWDREEAFTAATTNFSPKPPTQTTTICNETAVIAMGAASALSVSTGLTSLTYPYSEGWQRFKFSQTTPVGNGTMTGLPMLGFAAYKVNNGAMSYGNAAEHKTSTMNSGI
jgi:hypothetical protein